MSHQRSEPAPPKTSWFRGGRFFALCVAGLLSSLPLLSVAAVSGAEGGPWTDAPAPLSPLGFMDVGSSALMLDGRVLTVGGTTSQVYDPAKGPDGVWTTGLPAPAPGSGAAPARSATLIKGPAGQCGLNCGKVLVSFGNVPDAWVLYDPLTGAWSSAGVPTYGRRLYSSATLLSGSRCAADETAIDCGKVLVVGGSDNDAIHDCEQVGRSVELYDPKTNLWIEKDPLPPAQAYNSPLTTPLADGRVLLVGRRSKVGSSPEQCRGPNISWAEVYDPIAARWTVVPDAPPFGGTQQGVGELTLLKDGRVLVVPGDDNSIPAIFDPARMNWKPTGACACVGVQGAKLTSLEDGRVLMEGGLDPVTHFGTNRAAIFDPADDSWTPISQ